MNLFTYNVKLVFFQKLEVLLFPAIIGALVAGVWYSSGNKPTGSKMLLEVISPLVLGLLTIDITSKEITWKMAEITYTKAVHPGKVFFLRYFLVLIYGILILFIVAMLFWSFTDFFKMRSFFASIPVIMVVTSLGMFLSIILGETMAAFGIIFLFLIEESAGSRYLPLFLFLETFSPGYEYLWINRGIFVAIALGICAVGYYLLKNPERIMR
jgi:hypothetical protein